MKSGFWRWVGLFLMLASLPALACNLFSGDEPSQPPATEEVVVEDGSDRGPEPVVTEPPREEAEVAPGGSTSGPPFPRMSSLNGSLEEFNSYRILMTVRFEDASDATCSDTALATREEEELVGRPYWHLANQSLSRGDDHLPSVQFRVILVGNDNAKPP